MQEIKTIELFAGVGGFRIGLEKANKNSENIEQKFKIVWSNQYEPSTKKQHASEIYIKAFGDEGHNNEDINKVKTKDIPDSDLMVGGFPCQDYSVACSLVNSNGIEGKKGVLWWEIYRILEEKKEKAPKYLLFENVDRLLISPSKQRGRDFALILSSLNKLNYIVEWRVITASEYGMPQRRKRTFIFAYKQDTKIAKNLQKDIKENLKNNLIITKSFPIKEIEEKDIKTGKIEEDLVKVSDNFNKEEKDKNPFYNTGYMKDGMYYTVKTESEYKGDRIVLKDILQEEKEVPEEFYIKDEEVKDWEYKKGSKSIERINKTTGYKYLYKEGKMAFPDYLDKPSRTIITGEGGNSPSRFKHIIKINNRYRRLTPIELERLQMFPDNHTEGVINTKRAFLMGNALVTGIVEKIGETILKEINN